MNEIQEVTFGEQEEVERDKTNISLVILTILLFISIFGNILFFMNKFHAPSYIVHEPIKYSSPEVVYKIPSEPKSVIITDMTKVDMELIEYIKALGVAEYKQKLLEDYKKNLAQESEK